MTQRLFDWMSRRRGVVLAAYLVLVPLAGWLCTRIGLDTNILNLLPPEIPSVQGARKLEKWIGLGSVYVSLVRDDKISVPTMKTVSDEMAAQLSASPRVRGPVTAGMDISKVRRSLALFVDPADLETIGRRLRAFEKEEAKRKSGFFLNLGEPSPSDQLSFQDLLPKYRQRFEWDALTGGNFGAAPKASGTELLENVVAGLRASLSEDGSRLYYLSPDARMLTFPVRPSFPVHDLDQYPALRADIDAAFSSAIAKSGGAGSLQLYVGGSYAQEWDQRVLTVRDAIRSAIWSTVVVLLIALWIVRRWRALGMVLISLVAGLVLAFGLVELTIGSVNFLTAFLVPILAGFGIDFGFYLVTRYNLFSSAGLPRDEALREAWIQTANPSAMGALTTLSVMGILAFARFRGFAEMGIILTIGITTVWISMYTLLPILYLFLHPNPRVTTRISVEEARRKVSEAQLRGAGGLWQALSPAAGKAPWVALAALALTAFLGVELRKVRFEFTGEELTVRNQPSMQIDKLMLQHYGEFVDPSIIISTSEEEARRVQSYFDENFGKFRTIARYKSAFTYVPDAKRLEAVRRSLGPLRDAIAHMPKRSDDPNAQFLLSQARVLLDPQPITAADLPQVAKDLYLGMDAQGNVEAYLGEIIAKGWLWNMKDLTAFVGEADTLRVDGKPLEVTGRAQIFLHGVIDIVQKEAIRFSVLGVVVKLLLLWIQMRSLRFALLALFPLSLEIIWTLGCMPLIGPDGISLSFMNIAVVPILVGLGVAYGVHVVYNYRLYGSAERSLRVTFRPVLGSATATLVGWASLLTASMIGLQSIGWLATLGMFFVTVISLVVLPALLSLLDRAGWIRPDLVSIRT